MAQPVNFKRITVTLASANVAYKISSAKILSWQVEVHVPTTATGPVYIGDSSVTSSWIPRQSGSTSAFTASGCGSLSKGDFFDLSNLYVLSATAGDTVIIQYVDRV